VRAEIFYYAFLSLFDVFDGVLATAVVLATTVIFSIIVAYLILDVVACLRLCSGVINLKSFLLITILLRLYTVLFNKLHRPQRFCIFSLDLTIDCHQPRVAPPKILRLSGPQSAEK
jgi:hypothetical protein